MEDGKERLIRNKINMNYDRIESDTVYNNWVNKI